MPINPPKLIVPPFLQPGDTIGIVTPASPFRTETLRKGVQLLRQWGFKVFLGRKNIPRKGYLAGTDRERARELMDLFLNPDIRALICARGGYGCLRLLDLLDYEAIKKHPKLFMGFSDVTALLTAFYNRADLMSFHGPMVTTLPQMGPPVQRKVKAVLTGHFQMKIPLEEKKVIRAGSARGRLTGGNLTLLSHLIGTPFEPLWDRAILFLEDCGEAAYRLDRLFLHLKLCGVLDRVSAILLGTFTGPDNRAMPLHFLKNLLEGVKVPVWGGLPFGHGLLNIPLPIGAPAFLDGDNRLLRIDL
ncbi:MAG: LD-carboxypeptidase [Thermodesulfobacteriota bacterium]